MISLLAADPAWGMSEADIAAVLDPQRFTGRASDQVCAFLEQDVAAALKGHQKAEAAEIRV